MPKISASIVFAAFLLAVIVGGARGIRPKPFFTTAARAVRRGCRIRCSSPLA